MAKHMQDKESMAGITWLALLIIAGWGGLCQQRVKSDPLTATTNGLILIHLVYSGLASAITPAFRFCFSR